MWALSAAAASIASRRKLPVEIQLIICCRDRDKPVVPRGSRVSFARQDHYGEVLFKLGRYDEAVVAWTRALNGDGDSIDRGSIDKKIRTAKQKTRK